MIRVLPGAAACSCPVHFPCLETGRHASSESARTRPFKGGSQRHPCLSGGIGRFVPRVQSSGAGGALGIDLDLQDVPLPRTVRPGQTLNFQAWLCDANPHPTPHYTDGVSVTFS